MPRLQRRHQPPHRQGVEQRLRAADVVGVAVAEHEQVDGPLAARAQQRQHDAFAGVGVARIPRPGVIDEQVASSAHQHRGALPHIDRHHLEGAGRRPRQRRRQQRQHQRQAQQAQPPG
jgi:hypothetical protein